MRAIIAVLFGGGLGILLSAGVAALTPGTSGLLPTAVLWSGMAVAVVCALVAQRAPGLFQLRFADVVWGLGAAALLRLLGGSVSNAGVAPFPTANGTTVSLSSWVIQEGLPAGLIGPVVEELFFRAVLVVVLYRLLSPRVGHGIAGVAAVLVSAGGFVLLHAAFAPLQASDSVQLFALGAVCAVLVITTGRVWGALLLHVTYNASFLLLAVVGSLLA
ncbi:CPBP family intramembrane glutamic endopeptidase [Microbacterium testaceum]|uniref:CPBP family intramembrane glutamic endopeptidase n=1 Tax=Microbacterium testaceum TaxID=2033 RepID=UPI001651D202|nr:CPBP family intramembrane glutamic endopeptidase [Microbacterium testaceum]